MLKILSTQSVVLFHVTVYSCGGVMIYNGTVQCHSDVDEFPFESSSSESFYLMSLRGIFLATVSSGLLILILLYILISVKLLCDHVNC